MKQKLLSLLALTLCWASSTWALDPVNGLYKIGTKQDLFDFATLVNDGSTGVHAILTADIDLNNEAWTPIGNGKNYTGIFDGLGHKIEGFNLSTSADKSGFFGQVGDGAIIKNFTIEGSITSNNHQYVGGVVGAAGSSTGTVTISNIHSKVDINCTKTRHGGILGWQSSKGTVNIDRCTYSGSLSASTSGNFGGIVGFTQSDASAKFNITNCLFDGEINITSSDDNNAGGFVGYTNSTKVTIKNCLSKGSITAKHPGQFFGQIHKNGGPSWSGNNYYVEGSVVGVLPSTLTISGTAPTQVTDPTRFTSGELCVLLNNADHGTNWYQDLSASEKKYPKPNGTEKVYKYDSYDDCSATTSTTGTISYTNAPTVASHTYTDGFCSACGGIDPGYATKDSEGFYEIDSPEKLKWFSAWVNSSGDNLYSNAVLTDDIDMTSIASSWTPIGSWAAIYSGNAAYKGHFNGDGYAITNLTGDTHQNYYGLFGVISAGCLIENFSISGTITDSNSKHQYAGGVAAYARDHSPTIRNVKSSVNINNSIHSSARIGGILGGALNGTTTIQNCTYTGATIQADNIAGNYGGIVGYVNNNANAILTISNCLFEGTVEDINGGEGECGGIIGFASTNSSTTIENCLSVGTVTSTKAGMICGIIAGTKTYTNNYYKEGDVDANGPGSNVAYIAEEVSTTRLASGEICYLLNESANGGTIWHQTLPGDAYPTLDNTHELVYLNGYACPNGSPQGDVTYSNTSGTTERPHNYVDGFCSYCGELITDSNGNFLIGEKAHLMWFADYVNAGHYTSNAKLTTDIDLDGAAWTPIGIGSGAGNPGLTAYTGTFDGQNNAITGFEAEGLGHLGLFGDTNGATIKDFSISGNLTVTGGYGGGVVAWPINSTIENVHSALVVSVSNSDTHHVGGVVGSSRSSNTINRCSFNGSMAVAAGSTDNFGGIVGYITVNDVVENCANYGGISFGDINCNAGGVVGYLNDNSASIKNCLNIGIVSYSGEGTPSAGGAIVGRLKSHTAANITNHYWLTGSGYGAGKDNSGNINLTSAIEADATLLASGEVAYKLNSDPSDIKWYQTLGTDTYPTLSSASEQVRYVGTAGYTTFYDATNDWGLLGDAHAYIGTLNGSALHLEEIDDIPAGNAVVIGGTYYNRVSKATTTGDATGNVLLGSDGTVKGGTNIYALSTLGGTEPVGFYPVGNDVTIPAGKAYLVYSGSPVKGFTFVFDDEDPTGIIEVQDVQDVQGAIFNLAGQRISKMQNGINIVNGKKVLF